MWHSQEVEYKKKYGEKEERLETMEQDTKKVNVRWYIYIFHHSALFPKSPSFHFDTDPFSSMKRSEHQISL